MDKRFYPCIPSSSSTSDAAGYYSILEHQFEKNNEGKRFRKKEKSGDSTGFMEHVRDIHRGLFLS